MILGHHQGDREGVLATYAPPVGIVEVHPSPCLLREPNFTWRNLKVYKTPTHTFFQISQSLPSSSPQDVMGNRDHNAL